MFPVASKVLKNGGKIVALVKPQFEAGRDQVGKHGIVRDENVHVEVIEKSIDYAKESGLYPLALSFSPIKGAKGNIEYLLYLEKSCEIGYNELCIHEVVKASHDTL